MDEIEQMSRNPITLINILYRYSRKDYGSIFSLPALTETNRRSRGLDGGFNS